MGTDSGTGIGVTMRRNAVSTRATRAGMRLYSLAMALGESSIVLYYFWQWQLNYGPIQENGRLSRGLEPAAREPRRAWGPGRAGGVSGEQIQPGGRQGRQARG